VKEVNLVPILEGAYRNHTKPVSAAKESGWGKYAHAPGML
jgi:hypothetical protein